MLSKGCARTALVIATALGNSIQTASSLSFIGRKTTAERWFRKQLFHSQLSASSGLNFAEPEEKETQDESLSKWEEMYQQGEEARQKQIFAMKTSSGDVGKLEDESITIKSPVRVVTFDLDNTLWKTSETISAANDALAEYLASKSDANGEELKIPRRVEKIMGDLFRADRKLYCPLVGATIPEQNDEDEKGESGEDSLEQMLKSPVSLTQLRIDAICYLLETENDFAPEDALSFAQDAFEVWTKARHDAILDHMAPQVVETLQDIRSTISSHKEDVPVLLGAVTDGNSDPRKIEVLAPFFDFCVNAESVGVSKPDKRVYLQAIRQAVALRPQIFSDVMPPGTIIGEGISLHDAFDDESLENMVGPYWCHIGDDFLKDIVAAKDMKMRTIFSVGLVKDKLLRENQDSKEKEMDMTEFIKKVSSQTVVTLGIGADDYLARSLHGEFVDAVAEDFSEIGKILREWHVEADVILDDTPVTANTGKEQTYEQPSTTVSGTDEGDDVLEVIPPSKGVDAADAPVTPFANRNQQGEMDFLLPRAFRIIREDCSVDIPAPLRKRDERTMKDVMGMAQQDKSSGVFAFDPADVASLNDGKRVLMVSVGETGLKFSREIFSSMSVEEVLSLTEENPVRLSLFMTEASNEPSFNLF